MTIQNLPLEKAVKEEILPYVQIEPQYMWHSEAYIRGNAAGLRALATALLAAADKDAGTTPTLFASDGEGYEVEILRMERPDDYPQPFYTCEQAPCDYTLQGKNHCGRCGRVKP